MSADDKASAAAETLEVIRNRKNEDALCLITAAYVDGVKAGQQLEHLKKDQQETA